MTEQLATTEKTVSDELSDIKAQEYLGSYLDAIGAEDVIDHASPNSLQIMADIPLMVQLDALPFPDRPQTDRDKMARFFETNNWLPKHFQEANIASLKGLDETIRRAKKSKVSDPKDAQRHTLATVKGYKRDAVKDIGTFNNVRIPTEEMTIAPDVARLRADRSSLYLLADILMAREFLNEAQWPKSNERHYKDMQSYWRGFMLFAAQHATDEILANTFNHFFEKSQQRRYFWSEKFRDASEKIGNVAVAVKDATETVIPHKTVEEAIPGRKIKVEAFDELLSDQAVDELADAAIKYADKTHQVKRYIQDQGMPPDIAELRVLGHRARWHEGYIVGLEPKEDKPSAATITKAQRPAKNAALNPGVRRLPGYDQQQDPSNPRPF